MKLPVKSSLLLSFSSVRKILSLAAIGCVNPIFAHADVVGWGDNSNNQITIPASTSNAVALAGGGGHNLALKADGTVVAWGYNPYGQLDVPAGLANVIGVAAGYDHSLALKNDGTIVGWGRNDNGQLNPPAGLGPVTAIRANQHYTLALKADGTVAAWGNNDFGQCTVPASLSNIVAIAAGPFHALALKNDGTVVAWGRNDNGQATVPAGLDHVIGVAAGGQHSLVLKSDGAVFGWGGNSFGELNIPAGLSNVTAISVGFAHNLALRANGTVAAWGWNDFGQATVPVSLADVGAVAAGFQHSLALRTENHAPTITCPPDVALQCSGCNTDPAATGIPSASDADGDSVSLSYRDDISGDCPKIVTRTWTASDPRGKTATCVQTISCLESSFVTLVTGGGGCAFDRDPATQVQDFRLIFAQDPQNMPCYKLNASNPGQYFYNVYASGTPGQQATFNITLPYPFVTQGATPIHAYDGVTVTGSVGQQCLTPGDPFFASQQRVTLASYGNPPQPGVTLPVTLTVPPSGNVLITVHLDYGLKGAGGFTKNALNDAVDCATGRLLIQNHDDYIFMTTGAQSGIANISNQNAFKKNLGVGGFIRMQTGAAPVAGAKVKLTTTGGALVLSGASDEDGHYLLAYKHTGKAATFYVTIELPNGVKQKQAVVIGANKFVGLDFWIL